MKLILNACIFQSALLALAAHASDPTEADRIRHLASPAGKVLRVNLYYSLVSPFVAYL